jgi:hypothetical protein
LLAALTVVAVGGMLGPGPCCAHEDATDYLEMAKAYPMG